MPELPEVETLRRELISAVKGKTIKSVEVKVPKMVRPLSVPEFQQQIKNKKILGIDRRAKVLIIELLPSRRRAFRLASERERSATRYLLIHLKLTGQLIFNPKPKGQRPKVIVGGHPNPIIENKDKSSLMKRGSFYNLSIPNKFTHIIFTFTDGSKLFFNDLRKFGWMKLVDKQQADKLTSEFGVEALAKEFTLEKFTAILKKYPNRKIKQILMDQGLIAGLGNIYADESCFCAKIKPIRIVKTLTEIEIKNLYHCIPKILEFAIAKKGTSADMYVQLNGLPGGMEPYLKVYGREGEKCKRCSGEIKKIKLGGRGTHFCSKCQK